jgi:hypothetical protein
MTITNTIQEPKHDTVGTNPDTVVVASSELSKAIDNALDLQEITIRLDKETFQRLEAKAKEKGIITKALIRNTLTDSVKDVPVFKLLPEAFVVTDASGVVTAEIAKIAYSGNLSINGLAAFFMATNPGISRKLDNDTLFCELGNTALRGVADVMCINECNICAKIKNITFNYVENKEISVICELKPVTGILSYMFEHTQPTKFINNLKLRPRSAPSKDSVILVTWDVWLNKDS